MQQSLPWVDDKYIMQLSFYVDRFKVVKQSPLEANFRCPVCGDSKRSKTKARGFIFRTQDGGAIFKCHNCGKSLTLRSLLKHVSQQLYAEYSAEFLKEDPTKRRFVEKEDRTRNHFEGPTVQAPPGLVRLSDLPLSHPAVTYWNSRGLPKSGTSDAWWCESFFRWVNEKLIPEKFSEAAVRHDIGRIVFPFRNDKKNILSYTGRSINGEEPKYVAIRTSDEPGAFGMDRANLKEDVYVVEGPIDSLFVPNAVAMGTSSRKLDWIPHRIIVSDNEPRSPEITRIIKKNIDAGERVVIWPEGLHEKDINDMHQAGQDPYAIIRARTFKGLQALIEFGKWKKI